jgi:formiminoglutamate deiminase
VTRPLLALAGETITLPALTTAHSHAFQRAMRGKAQRRSSDPTKSDFWSWRGEMYRIAEALTPESIGQISRVAFRELARAGVRTVGEFHYVQHQADGTPYSDRTIMSDAVIEAARAEGLRVALLRVAYHRAGAGRPAEPEQRRFCDASVDDVLRDVDALRARWASDPMVRIGIAPHSVRAVPPSWLAPLAAHAAKHGLPFHMHVAEQPREIDECVAETKKRPLELLAEHAVLSSRFVAVHATHLLPHEAKLLGDARAFACVCATTERDLGDGLPDVRSLRAAGARLCTGVDSHVITDAIEELRSLETHARLRELARITFTPEHGSMGGTLQKGPIVSSPAEQLWREGSIEGAHACGFLDAAPHDGGRVAIRRDHPALALVADEDLLDAIVFSGSSSMIEPPRG